MKIIFCFLLQIFLNYLTCAQIIDSSFGNNGIFSHSFNENCLPISIHKKNDGNYNVTFSLTQNSFSKVGSLELQKFGIIQPNYGQAGLSIINSLNSENGLTSFIHDDNIFIGGSEFSNLNYFSMINSLNPMGNPNLTFGDMGKMKFKIEGGSQIFTISSNGINGFYSAGMSTLSGLPHAVVTKHNFNGSINIEFGAAGSVIFDEIGDASYFTAISNLSDNSILLGGNFISISGAYDSLFLTRLDADASIDKEFGNNGFYKLPYNADQFDLSSLLEINESNILICGSANFDNTKERIFRSKIDNKGNIIEDFGQNGTFIFPPSNENKRTICYKVVKFDSKNYLILGGTEIDGKMQPMLLLIDEHGQINKTFGNNGVFLLLGEDGVFKDVALDENSQNSLFLISSLNGIKVLKLKFANLSAGRLYSTNKIKLYPNPSFEFIKIDTKSNDYKLAYICDDYGKKVWEGNIKILENGLNISNFSSGSYFLFFNNSLVSKFIKF